MNAEEEREAARQDARRATRQRNLAKNINWDNPKSGQELNVKRGSRMWRNRVDELIEGVVTGRGEFDKYYEIGQFDSASGAASTRRRLLKSIEANPTDTMRRSGLTVELLSRGGSTGQPSWLWAAVVEAPSDVDWNAFEQDEAEVVAEDWPEDEGHDDHHRDDFDDEGEG